MKAIGIIATVDGFKHLKIFIPLAELGRFVHDGYLIFNNRPIDPLFIVWENGRESYASVCWRMEGGRMAEWYVNTLPGNRKITLNAATGIATAH